MKKYYYLLLVSLAAFMAASCSDEIESDANDTAAVKSGQPICLYNVGDQATDNGKKKLHYGEKDADNNWPVCWDVNDAADVLCPEARWSNNPHSEATDVPSVSYKVNALTGTSGTIVPADDKELCWGQANAHHFFHAFPAGTVDLSDVTKTKFSDNTNDYSANFTATISQSQVIPADSIKQDADGNWTARNMNYAVLVGTDRYMREELDEKEPIHLHYNTAFTAVEVTIGACGTGAFDGDVITAVDITNATTNNTGYTAIPLAGEFTGTVGYNASGTYANNFANSTTPSKLFNNVRIDLSAKPVTLEAGTDQKLVVTAFLLPTANAQVKVTVNRRKIQKDKSLGAPLTISKSFKSGSSDDKALAAGKVNHISMGSLPTTETNKIDGNNWMSVLPDETYLSQMSIPGVYDCGAYGSDLHGADRAQMNLKDADDKAITNGNDAEQMKAYLRAGNRAFDFKLNSKIEEGKVVWELERQTTQTSSTTFSFENMVKSAEDWLKEHPTECIICVVSDYNTSKTHKDAGYYTLTDNIPSPYVAFDYKVPDLQYSRSRTSYKQGIRDFIIENTPKNMLLLNYTADVTLGEVRGKMVIINETEYESPVGLCAKDFTVNTKPNNGTWFQDTRTIENEVALSKHEFGTGYIFIQDFLNLQRRANYRYDDGTGTWYRPHYSTAENTIEGAANGGNFNADIDRKKSFIETAFKEAKDDKAITNWYLISTACRGWANSTSYNSYPTIMHYQHTVESGTLNNTPLGGIYDKVLELVNSRSTTTYERLGIVLNARVGQEAATDTDRTLEQMIWENNYVGNGPLKKTTE